MRKLLMKKLRNQKGMTLIELLAVIVILGIIAAIAVPSIGNIIENSKEDAAVANSEMLANAARLYLVSEQNPTTPLTDTQLSDFLESGAITDPWTSNELTDTKWTITLDGSNNITEVSVTFSEGTVSGEPGALTFGPTP